MSFAWIFAIIVGAIVIFLAIWATTKLVSIERHAGDTEIGKQIGILLNPVETSLENAKIAKITTPLDTRIYNDCEIQKGESFGSQRISVATKSGVGKEWENPGVPSSFHNKYLFSDSVVEGKEFMVFAKPFKFPFKVADLLFLWSAEDEYCFVNSPSEIYEEINSLSPEGINVTNNFEECSKRSIKVCFASSGCDVDVNTDSKSVKKDKGRETIYYEDELIYGAIFAPKKLYECQVKRLMSRASELSLLYNSKSVYLSSGNCDSFTLQQSLFQYANYTSSLNESIELRSIRSLSDDIKDKNGRLLCGLF